ncbi:hypothetical protein EAY19_27080, partial [Vibrio anguillarum]|nr:hypothetical protein [Vibrio anguillarum]
YRPLAETCTEHCTTTQWFKFPLSQEYIHQLSSDSVVFTLTSSTGKSQVEFSVPKAYFLAVIDEANFTLGSSMIPSSITHSVQEQATKPIEMVQYWFTEADVNDRKIFENWAFSNRDNI